MGSTFTGRLYLGSGNGTPSIYSVTGDPSVSPPPGITPNIGDLALSDNGTQYAYTGSGWAAVGTGGGGGGGDVVGPGTATDNALARYDGTSGTLLQNSGATLDDAGNLSLNAVPTIPVTYAPQLKLYDANFLTPEYVAIAASNTMDPGTSYSLAFPPAAGAVNEALTTDGSGNLIWQLPIFSGGSAGGSLTGTYPSPGIAAGAIGASQIANGAVNIGKLAVNVVNNYLPSTTEKQAMAGTSGTPGPTNQFFTQEGGTFTPPGPGPAYSVTDPVSAATTYSQSADGTATLTPAATAPTAIDIAPVSPTTSAFTVTDPTTSVTTVDQKPDGTVIYTNPTNITNTTEVNGGGISVTNVNNGITIAGDSTTYTYNAAPSFSSFFQYVLNQPISVNVSMLDTGDYQLSETDNTVSPATTGRLVFSAVGSSTAGTGVSVASYFDDGLGAGFAPAELTITTSSLRFTGDLAPNSLPGTLGEVLISQGAGAPPVWTTGGALDYAATTASDWQDPTPPASSGTGAVPTTIGAALDTLATQNYVRWLNLRTVDGISASGPAITTDESLSVLLADASGGAVTVDLPAPGPYADKWLTVKKTDATGNAVILNPGLGVLIDGAGTQAIAYQYDAITLVSDGTNWAILDQIDSTPPTPVISTDVNVSLNGSATNGAPTFVGGFYVIGASTYTVNSRVYVGINAPGTITVTVKNLVNVTITTFTYVAASSGFYDVTLAAPVAFSPGWYNLTLTAATAGTTAFIRGMYLTTV